MSKTADERREILRRFIAARGMKVAAWARASGVDKNSIYNFLNGHSQALDPKTYVRLARESGVPAWKISGDEPELPSQNYIWVSDEARAQHFSASHGWNSAQWFAIDVPVSDRFRTRAKALVVADASMNLEFPPGSIVVWVPVDDFRQPQHGDHVVVHTRTESGMMEISVRQFRVTEEGARWLWFRSDRPEFQVPSPLDCQTERAARPTVVGIVIGDYRQRLI